MSPDEYYGAITALGVTKTEYDSLSKKFKNFHQRTKTQFNAYMEGLNLSTYVFNTRHRVPSYVNPNSQGMWCSWGDALTFVPSLKQKAERNAQLELELFKLYLRSTGYIKEANTFDGANPNKSVNNLWQAWNAALDFGFSM